MHLRSITLTPCGFICSVIYSGLLFSVEGFSLSGGRFLAVGFQIEEGSTSSSVFYYVSIEITHDFLFLQDQILRCESFLLKVLITVLFV